MARRNRKYPEGVQWVRLLPRPNQSAGAHSLIFTAGEDKRLETIPVHTDLWTPYPATMIADIQADPAIVALLEFSPTKPEEERE